MTDPVMWNFPGMVEHVESMDNSMEYFDEIRCQCEQDRLLLISWTEAWRSFLTDTSQNTTSSIVLNVPAVAQAVRAKVRSPWLVEEIAHWLCVPQPILFTVSARQSVHRAKSHVYMVTPRDFPGTMPSMQLTHCVFNNYQNPVQIYYLRVQDGIHTFACAASNEPLSDPIAMETYTALEALKATLPLHLVTRTVVPQRSACRLYEGIRAFCQAMQAILEQKQQGAVRNIAYLSSVNWPGPLEATQMSRARVSPQPQPQDHSQE